MTEFDPKETVSINHHGDIYKIKKHLTIGEQIARKGRRSQICGGNYGTMNLSIDLDERSVAFMADIVTELDARIIESPDGWRGAENMTDDKELISLWKEVMPAIGLFPRSADKGKKTENDGQSEGDSKEEPELQLDEEVVS